MKKIVCELCEGTEFTKEGGFFVCSGCGTKYSLEEAKAMMKEVAGDTTPVMSASPAPMNNPNQEQIDNILMLATTAYESSNHAEAESYCNRAIEMDATGYKAWFLKGKAVGWSSTWDKPRIQEASHSFCKAIDFAPEEEKETLKNEAVEELKNLGLAHIDLCRQRFGNWPDDSEYNGFGQARSELIDALTVLLAHGNAVDIPDGYLEQIAEMMNNAGVLGFESVSKAYAGLDYPGSEALGDAINMMDNCVCIIMDAINSSDEDDEEDITRYENLIHIYNATTTMTACDNEGWRTISLTKDAKKIRQERINEWKNKIEELKRTTAAKAEAKKKQEEEERKQRIAAYWEAHAEEREALEKEMVQLLEKVNNLDQDIESLDEKIDAISIVKGELEKETDSLNEKIDELTKKRAGLGMFDGKQKKQIASEIDSLKGRIRSIKDDMEVEKKKYDAERARQLEPLQKEKDSLVAERDAANKRVDAIEAELEKDPGEAN